DAAEQRYVDAIGQTTWRRQFDASAADLSRELAGNDFGLLANEPDILTKSGVFAALATHGVNPIVSTAGTALPEFADQAALSNDEAPNSFAAILNTLRDAAKLRFTRERLLSIATEHLAWPRITQRWHEAVAGGPRRAGQPG